MEEKKTKIKEDLFRTTKGKQDNFPNAGITLIALIITIVILLILAGVVINMTLGNNGIIEKAQRTVDIYELQQKKEKLELALTELKLEKLENDLSEDDIKRKLSGNGIFLEEDIAEIDEYKFKINKETFEIEEIIRKRYR